MSVFGLESNPARAERRGRRAVGAKIMLGSAATVLGGAGLVLFILSWQIFMYFGSSDNHDGVLEPARFTVERYPSCYLACDCLALSCLLAAVFLFTALPDPGRHPRLIQAALAGPVLAPLAALILFLDQSGDLGAIYIVVHNYYAFPGWLAAGFGFLIWLFNFS